MFSHRCSAGQSKFAGIIGRRCVRRRIVIDRNGGVRPCDSDGRRQRRKDQGPTRYTGSSTAKTSRYVKAGRDSEALSRNTRSSGQRNCAVHVHIQSSAQDDISVRGHQRGDCVQNDITSAAYQNTSASRCYRCIHVHVASATHHKISVGSGDRLVHVDIANRVQGQSGCAGRGRPADRLIDVDVTIARTGCMKTGHGRSARGRNIGSRRCIDGDAVGHQQGGKCCARDVTSRGDGEVLRIDQKSADPALGRLSRNKGIVGDIHLRRRCLHATAIPAIGRRGVERAADLHGAGLLVAEKPDCTAMILERARLDDTGIVDHGLDQVARARRGHHHQSAVGANEAAIFGQCVHRAFVDGHIE